MNDLEVLVLDECLSCATTLDSHADEILCDRCSHALQEMWLAIGAMSSEAMYMT